MRDITSLIKDEQEEFPLISVAMPVYNGEMYLAEAIESILNQTIKNFEFIIIDDGSTDGSLNILKFYEQQDSRIKLVARENKNLATTLNDILALARGEWFARMDQDDVALPCRFERQLAWLERTKSDMAGSWVKRFGTSDKREVKLRETDEAIKTEMLFCSPFAHPSVMIRSDLIKELGYDKTWEKVEDYDLWERAARANWKMSNVPEVLLMYRVHNTQISTKTAKIQQKLTQEVRKRYWNYISDEICLDSYMVEELMKAMNTEIANVDVDIIDKLFKRLLQSKDGEARASVFEHMTKIYFRLSAITPRILLMWSKHNKQYGQGWGLSTMLKLFLFSLLKIKYNSSFYNKLKTIYFRITTH